MTVLVNGQDLDAFGDLESFEDSIQDIETVTIDNYTFEPYCSHKEIWDFIFAGTPMMSMNNKYCGIMQKLVDYLFRSR